MHLHMYGTSDCEITTETFNNGYNGQLRIFLVHFSTLIGTHSIYSKMELIPGLVDNFKSQTKNLPRVMQIWVPPTRQQTQTQL